MIKKLISVIVNGIFLGLIALAVFIVLKSKILNIEDDLLVNGVIAFFGAFFVFMFVMIADTIKRKINRNILHYSTLVDLQINLNRAMVRLSANLSMYPQVKKELL